MKTQFNFKPVAATSLLMFAVLFLTNTATARTLRILFIEMNGTTDNNSGGLSTGLYSEIAKNFPTIYQESCFIYVSDGDEPFHTDQYEKFNDAFEALKDQKTLKASVQKDRRQFWKALASYFGNQNFDQIEVFFFCTGSYLDDLITSKASYWQNHLVKELSKYFGISEASIKYKQFFDIDKGDAVMTKLRKRWEFAADGNYSKTFSDNLELINTADK
jgi:hypothetical protein